MDCLTYIQLGLCS